MKISEVMDITSLTKRAIKYYEENELISPSINTLNNYRDYSENDVEKLKQISVLRSFDIPIKEIKKILMKPEEIEKVLANHLAKLKSQVANIEKCEEILQACVTDINSKASDIKKITNNMLLLKKSFDMNEQQKENYMKRELTQIFPGFFGKYICLKLSNYLDEPLDSKEKEQAWLHLVKTLDSSKQLNVSNELLESFESDNLNWNLIEEIIICRNKEFYAMEKEEIKDYVEHLYDLKPTEIDLKLLEQLISYENSKENISYINNLLKLIDEDLKILSSKYTKIQENILVANYELKKSYLNLPKDSESKNNISLVTLPQMTFVGLEYTTFISIKKVPKLIDNFRNRLKEINNVINPTDIYTINGIDSLLQYEKPKTFKLNFSFIIAVQVSKVEQIPNDMKAFTIPAHQHICYTLKGNKNLKSFIKDELPIVTFITQSYKVAKFPVLTLYNNEYKTNNPESIVYNYMAIETV